MALPSMICTALDGRLIVGSMCDSKKCRFGLVSFGWHAVSNCQQLWDRSQREQQRQLKVNIMFNRKKDKLTKDVPFSSDLPDFVS